MNLQKLHCLILFLISLTTNLYKSEGILIQEENSELTQCIQNIISYWFKKGSGVTYVDINFLDGEIIKSVHEMKYVSVISRTTKKKVVYQNEGYLVTAQNLRVFKDKFVFLLKEEGWEPDVYFLIIFQKVDVLHLTEIFNTLLQNHIFQVLVINGTRSADVYTYNPFENFGCGLVFNRIISYGKCSEANTTELYFNKFITGFRKCTFKAAVPHYPPYTINPNKDDIMVKLIGTEQYVMQLLSEVENFKINYTYLENPEDFSVVEDDMKSYGPLSSIQSREVDMIFGGMVLLQKRAEAFSYICGHHAYTDELKILVKKAGFLSHLENIYLEFDTHVWLLLVFTFLVYFIFFVALFRTKNKCSIILVMWDLLFQHSCKLGHKLKVKYFLFPWVIFAMLINIYYQTSLMGFTTHPSHNYQISTEEDLTVFKIKPCLSLVIRKLMPTYARETEYEDNKECETIFESIKTVSNSYDKYTIVPYAIYRHNNSMFTDEYGNTQLYSFKQPVSKIIYAMFFYKGFPMTRKLHIHTLRIRESGLLKKHVKDLIYEEGKKYYYMKKKFQARLITPWFILTFGLGLAVACLTIELIITYVKQRRRNIVR